MSFASDNWAGASPEIMAALARANRGQAVPYGGDEITGRLEGLFSDLFEHDVTVFPVTTGTAANALSIAAFSPRYGVVYCHEHAHVNEDECGASEFFTGGARLVTLTGAHAKVTAEALRAALDRLPAGSPAHGLPAVVSIAQANEAGCVYTPDQVAEIAEVARARGLALHMDGARFANALVHLDRSAAELTWRAGVDVLSFGLSKNGGMVGEAVVLFANERVPEFAFLHKRAGQQVSKMRFVSVQLEAYLADDLWLRNARHANAMAARLGTGLAALPGVELAHPVEANEVFPILPEAAIEGLARDGFAFHRWRTPEATMLRLVAAFDSTPQEVDAFVAAAARHLAAADAAAQ